MPSVDVNRDAFRSYPLQEGLLFFHPESGTHLRFHGDTLRHFRREAPRVIMFGITNACNLKCSFCSRDQEISSLWTEKSAFALLSGLWAKGSLEVAFGGGEPFAFPAFAPLVQRLHRETSLALHVTTNGTLITKDTWPQYAGLFGQVRISIYNQTTWKRCSELFRDSKQLWGANLLVDDQALDSLGTLLNDLHAAGCNDLSLLGYIGEPERCLSPAGKQRLAAIVKDSPLSCRISLCFGDTVPVPRLLAGYDNRGDCGAGSDFVSISADQRMQSCSFMDKSYSAGTAKELLGHWRESAQGLQEPSQRSGCARSLPQLRSPPPLPALSVWQGFSGNNSGECVMVAKFQSPEEAEKFLEELLPGWRQKRADNQSYGYPSQWVDLFHNEQVTTPAMRGSEVDIPDALTTFGNSVIAAGYHCDDLFPELRSFAWKRGAWVLPGGIHLHEDADVLSAIQCRSKEDRDSLSKASNSLDMDTYPYGDVLFVHQVRSDESEESLLLVKQALQALADDRPFSSEIFYQDAKALAIVNALKSLGTAIAMRKRLWVSVVGFDTEKIQATVAQLAATLTDQEFVCGKTWLLLDPVKGRKRVAVLAYRRGANVTALDTERVNTQASLWRPVPYGRKGKVKKQAALPSVEEIEAALCARGLRPSEFQVRIKKNYHKYIIINVLTTSPGEVLKRMEETADEFDLNFSPWVAPPDPMAMLFRRLLSDLKSR